MNDNEIRFKADGVYLCKGNSSYEKIAERLKLASVLKSSNDGMQYAELRFTTWEGERKVQIVEMSYLNRRNWHRLIDILSDQGYRWPNKKSLTDLVLLRLAEVTPKRVLQLVDTFGWHNGVYFTPYGQYSVAEAPPLRIRSSQAERLAPYLLGSGSLGQWQTTVGKDARYSSRLRLAIAAAFAAPLLSPLGMDSFGLNFFGPTSQGKSSIIFGGLSVAGLIGPSGIPTWADTASATEELFVGHRDCVFGFDETGDGEGRDIPIEKRIQTISFALSRNHRRNLNSKHEKRLDFGTRDYRLILLSSSEFSLRELALSRGRSRIPGEEIRLIDIPATDGGVLGVFKKVPKKLDGIAPVLAGKQLADELRQHAVANQGYPLRAFLKRFTESNLALGIVEEYMVKFQEGAQDVTASTHNESALLRLKSNFALLYAAACLAADYNIVPWSKRKILRDIEECWLAAVSVLQSPNSQRSNDSQILDQICKAVAGLHALTIEHKPTTDADISARQNANAFRVKDKLYIKRHAWPPICEGQKDLLKSRQVLLTESRKDTPTMAKKVAGIAGKCRYYVLDVRALETLVGQNIDG